MPGLHPTLAVGQDVDVLAVHGDLGGLVVQGVHGLEACQERREVGDPGAVEPLHEVLGDLVVEVGEPLAGTLERLVDECAVAHGRGGHGLAQTLARARDAAEDDGVNGAVSTSLKRITAGRVELAIRRECCE